MADHDRTETGAVQPQDEAVKLEANEFCARFKTRMLAVAGPTFDDGGSIGEYADQTAPTYWDAAWTRELGPEACADADMSYWGEE